MCCLNSYFTKKKKWQHFQGGISSETYRTLNFKISYNRREAIGKSPETTPPTRMNAPH
jgi:hypothetical protein